MKTVEYYYQLSYTTLWLLSCQQKAQQAYEKDGIMNSNRMAWRWKNITKIEYFSYFTLVIIST